jgi:hypothetical protein
MLVIVVVAVVGTSNASKDPLLAHTVVPTEISNDCFFCLIT